MVITMATSKSDGEIITIKQVTDYLKVTERALYRLAAAKQTRPSKWAEAGGFHVSTLIAGSRNNRRRDGATRNHRHRPIKKRRAKIMLELTLREEFRGKRLKGITIELSNWNVVAICWDKQTIKYANLFWSMD